jgi:hypothetical protein
MASEAAPQSGENVRISRSRWEQVLKRAKRDASPTCAQVSASEMRPYHSDLGVFKTGASRAAPVREAVISVPGRSRSRTR